MKKLSIKARITLWYTTLVIILMAIVLTFLGASIENILMSKAENDCKEVAIEMADEIKVEDGKLEFDEDFKIADKGVMLLVYDHGNLVKGDVPDLFPQNTEFRNGQEYTTTSEKMQWLTYDVMVNDGLYIRGIYPLQELSASMSQIIMIVLISIPFIILIAILGGYYITKKAFKPIGKIAKTAGDIGNGNDLSKRIALKDNGDELSTLSNTFDQMLDRLEKSFHDERQFTSDVSHELRTPLTVMKSQCEYALTQENNPITNRALMDIENKTNQMTALISQLLELSRSDQNKHKIIFEVVNMSEVTLMVSEEMKQIASLKQIEILSNIEPELKVNGEQTLLMRLIINLVDNAIKYSKENSRIHIELHQIERKLQLKVIDEGIGIKKGDQAKIFQRFYKVNEARNKETDNSFGLGLSFCEWIVQLHHGSIKVESEDGLGSTFIVILPIKK
ncbi:MAG: HAMP domain-containing sensor histidine kinase [Erysipelotrichaceae bacterium]